ncbi:hypothetical protein [Kitasatospora griseola]|uniref:hypothetical protein n=1 Tax=Kitasatospora griseola TaxID=2064 RepID=UPI00167015E1|nr:hypothetical protein [Kitasatospora griseola]GGR10233.1 hypothetical protein GCM10010195_75240 [Kitasatospora griseola]
MERQAVIFRGIQLFSSILAGWILGASYVPKVVIILPLLVAMATLGIEFRKARKRSHETIRNHLITLFTMLDLAPRSDARSTIHVPVRRFLRKGVWFRQVCEYVPNGGGGGRYLPRGKGIIQKSYTSRAIRTENFHSDEDYRLRMVEEYNYTEEETRERTIDRRSYLCIPIIEFDKVLGLLYFDARTEGIFPLSGSAGLQETLENVSDIVRTILLKG